MVFFKRLAGIHAARSPAGDMLSRQGLGHLIPGRGVSACPHRPPRRPTDGDASLRASPTPPKLSGRRWGHALTSTAQQTRPTPRRESMSPAARQSSTPSPRRTAPRRPGRALKSMVASLLWGLTVSSTARRAAATRSPEAILDTVRPQSSHSTKGFRTWRHPLRGGWSSKQGDGLLETVTAAEFSRV